MPGVKRSRRVKGEGSIYKRKTDDRWVGAFVERKGGLAKRHVVYGNTAEEASAKLRALRDEIAGGIDVLGRKAARLSDLVATWLADAKRTKADSTIERYTTEAARLTRLVGSVRLRELDADTIRALDELLIAEGASAAARRSSRRALSAAIAIGVREGKVARNPVGDVAPPKIRHKRIPPISLEDTRRLIAAAHAERLGALYILFATTGLRLGEAIAIRPSDIDLRKRTILIERSLREAKTGFVEKDAKTAAGMRTIVLPMVALYAIRQHLESMPAESAYVFSAMKGGPLRKSVFVRGEWKPFLKRNGFPAWTFRQLRHSAATRMAESGAHPTFVQAMLGHTSPTMTLGVYTHATAQLQREAVRGLDEILQHKEIEENAK